MEVIHDEDMLRHYVAAAIEVSPERPLLIDKFLENAIEAEADAIADGADAFVPAVMEHIELAGIHSGDSACVIPPISIPAKHIDTINEYTRRDCHRIQRDRVNEHPVRHLPRCRLHPGSQSPGLPHRALGVQGVPYPMARIATQVMMGKKLSELNLTPKTIPHFGVKEAVFPFNMFPEVDPLLGPEMRTTGEVLGLADSFGLAFYRAQQAANQTLPSEGTVLISVADPDKPAWSKWRGTLTSWGSRSRPPTARTVSLCGSGDPG